MENNSQKVFAFLLCIVLALMYKQLVWDPYFFPAKQGAPSQQSAATTEARSATPAAQPSDSTLPPQQSSIASTTSPSTLRAPTDAEVRASGLTTIETESIIVQVSALGGRIVSLSLKDFKKTLGNNSEPLDLVEHVEGEPYPLGAFFGAESDERVLYQVSKDPSGKVLRLTGFLPSGLTVEKQISLSPKGYLIDIEVGSSLDNAPVALEWNRVLAPDSPTMLDPSAGSGYVWYDGTRATRESFKDAAHQKIAPTVPVQWISLGDKYFVTSLLSPEVGNRRIAKIIKTENLYELQLAATEPRAKFKLLAGPKSYDVLKEIGYSSELNLDLGMTGFIAVPLLFLLHIFHSLLGNYGLAIVALTVLVKTLLYPLSAASFKQMKAMQKLQPEMTRIRENVKDKNQQQMELMALYKKHNVNPFGGCLPMLAQMPIFIGLYSALSLSVELRHAPFGLWIHDLSMPEKLMITQDFGLPVMVIILVGSMLVQQWMTPTPGMDPAQKKMMMIMPFVFGFMFVNFPAGLTLYWLTNNFISIGQQRGMQDTTRFSGLTLTFIVASAVFAVAALVVAIS